MESDDHIMMTLADCIERDQAQALAEIIQGGLDVNQQINDASQKILHLTVIHDARNCFDYLLTVPGLHLDCRNVYGVTPLIQATLLKSAYYVKRLLENGADSSLSDSRGDTPLHITDSVEICQLLIDYGCDINALNDYGMSALHEAVARRSLELGYMFLDLGVDTTIVAANGETALSLAIHYELDEEFIQVVCLYTYDNIKQPIPIMIFIHLMYKKELRFIFDQLLDSCSEVFYTDEWELKQFVKNFLNFDEEMLIEFYKRKPTVLTNIFQDCITHFRYSRTFSNVYIPVLWAKFLSCIQFLEDYSLFEYYYDILDQKMQFPSHSYTLESVSTLTYIFLSRGFIPTFEFARSLYETHGDCNLFRELLYFDNELSFGTTLDDLCNRTFLISPMCLLIVQPCLTPTECLQMFTSFYRVCEFVVGELFDYFASTPFQKHCRQYFKDDGDVGTRLDEMPTVPKLLELARDVTRQHIVKTLHCTKASTFYCYIKHLPIANVHKDILTYKTKIY